jgi:hypothetical protein
VLAQAEKGLQQAYAELDARAGQIWAKDAVEDQVSKAKATMFTRVAGKMPLSDDARFRVTAWGPVRASEDEIVGTVRGWENKRWLNPEWSGGRIPVDGEGWDLYTKGLDVWWAFRLVKEADGWKIAEVQPVSPIA